MNKEIVADQAARPDPLEVAKRGARLVRDEALTRTDWMVMPDSPLSDAELVRAKAYRKYLRDLPGTMSEKDFMAFKGVKTFDEFIKSA